MAWVLLTVATFLTCELIVRTKVIENFVTIPGLMKRSLAIIKSSRISDHWKEIVLPAYSLRLGTASLKCFALLVMACSPFIILFLGDGLLHLDLFAIAMSWTGIAWITAIGIGTLYVGHYLRSRGSGAAASGSAVEGRSYSRLDQTLHHLVLDSPARSEMLFDIEGALTRADGDAAGQRHVFVVGLARAGTTILMRAIHQSAAFASLTYRDMPFVMAPNLWRRLSQFSNRNQASAERSHGDGILVDFDSPEALEEPFWRTFCGADYIGPDALRPHQPDEAAVEKYRRFVQHVLVRYGRERYLAKNNNNILRLPAIREAFPASIILIPFRRPVAQSLSLLAQHQRFVSEDDKFVAQYMMWLAHHEFGVYQRPFVVDDKHPVGAPDQVNYWLSMWGSVYAYLLALAEAGDEAIIPVCYEDLCGSDGAVWRRICERIGIAAHPVELSLKQPAAEPSADTALVEACDGIYDALRQLSRKRLGLPARVADLP